MIQTDFINFLKHAVLHKRAWQGHDTTGRSTGISNAKIDPLFCFTHNVEYLYNRLQSLLR